MLLQQGARSQERQNILVQSPQLNSARRKRAKGAGDIIRGQAHRICVDMQVSLSAITVMTIIMILK